VSAPPGSTRPVSTPPATIPLNPVLPTGAGAGSGPTTGNGLSVPRRAAGTRIGGAAPRRSTRAEDVLGTGRPAEGAAAADANTASRWWSRTAPVNAPAPRAPAQRQPVSAGTSDAGLPIRVPMAQLPGDGGPPPPADVPVSAPPLMTGVEPDPSHVGSMLSRFYSGVHRAAAESDQAAH
jgi:hypothetical protein